MNLSEVFSVALHRPVVVIATQSPLSIEDLTPLELKYFALHVENSPREGSWLKGRNALRQVLSACDDIVDTTEVTFPNLRYSLTHSGEWALAAGLLEAPFKGLGIDYQTGKPPSDKALRIFLTPEEQINCQSQDRLRLWTLKEALFKADMNNTQTRFVDYVIHDIPTLAGETNDFRYASVAVLDGWVSLAIGQLGGFASC